MKAGKITFGLIGGIVGLYFAVWAGYWFSLALDNPILVSTSTSRKLVDGCLAVIFGSVACFAFRFSRQAISGEKQYSNTATKRALGGLLIGLTGYVLGAFRDLAYYGCPLCMHPVGAGRAWPLYFFYFGGLNALTFLTVALLAAAIFHAIKKFMRKETSS